MKLIEDGTLDYQKFSKKIENATITFSMVSIDGKIYKIANKSGSIEINEIITNENELFYEYYIVYNFTEKDTNKVGSYIGEFKIDFFGEACGTLIVPIKEKLYIHVQDSITKTSLINI